jgi:GNAT superfamily N-acetyltransferase
MEDETIKIIEPGEFRRYYALIRQDFSPEEHAPYRVLKWQISKGIQTAFAFREKSEDRAYAVCADANENGCVLVSLLAVLAHRRGKGDGSAFLRAIARRYADKKALIVEVERVEDALGDADRATREARIRFYRRAGFHTVAGISYAIWDVPMDLMILPLTASFEDVCDGIIPAMYEIYRKLLGPAFIGKLCISRS